jgi:hypothetical protein
LTDSPSKRRPWIERSARRFSAATFEETQSCDSFLKEHRATERDENPPKGILREITARFPDFLD